MSGLLLGHDSRAAKSKRCPGPGSRAGRAAPASLWGHPLSSTWRAPQSGNSQLGFSGASITQVQVVKSLPTSNPPPSLSPWKGVHGTELPALQSQATSQPSSAQSLWLAKTLWVVERGLIWITKDTSLTQITQEILRDKGALCQEIATKTTVTCFLLYHNIRMC